MLPGHKFVPSHRLGIISILALVAFTARYQFRVAGGWRHAYVLTAMVALYLNGFVPVVQLFEKIPLCIYWHRPNRKDLSADAASGPDDLYRTQRSCNDSVSHHRAIPVAGGIAPIFPSLP
jgi:hypothetical protein